MGIESAKFMTFDEWKARNKDLIKELEANECPECNGTGKVECFVCGHDNDCLQCDGKGYSGKSPHQMYRDQLEEDQKRVKAYLELIGAKEVP